LVATAYITITIDGGMRMPERARRRDDAGAEARREALLHHRRQHDRADGDDRRGRRPRHRGEERTREHAREAEAAGPVADHRGANVIIRRATPPCVRKLPARMKNGIAMISNFSMPVNSFSATDSIGTVVIVNRYVSTVRPSEIDTGMPVSISPISSAKMIAALGTLARRAQPTGNADDHGSSAGQRAASAA
jgi:hypothetical protein